MKKLIFIGLLTSTVFAYAKDCAQVGDYLKMVNCFASNHQLIDKSLNIEYKNLLGLLSEKTKKTLIQNQRHWLKYAETYCEIGYSEYPDSRGSFAPTAISNCLSELKTQRIQQFKNMRCEEGDMSSTCLISN